MSSFVVEIPESMKAFLDEEIASGRCANHSELIQQLVQAEQKRRAQNKVKELALEALETPSMPWTKESMEEIRGNLRKRRDRSPAKLRQPVDTPSRAEHNR